MDLSRQRFYQENLDFYNGLQWPGNARRRERRLTFNYARTFIDKVTSYLMSGNTFSVEPAEHSLEAEERARQAEEALRSVYEANNLEELDYDTEIDTAVMGDGCFKVTWDSAKAQVRVSAPDVKGLYAWWQGDDVTQVRKVASRYALSAEEASQIYGVRPGPGSRSKTLPAALPGPSGMERPVMVTEVWTSAEMEIWLDDTRWRKQANPYGTIPYLVFPNLREPKQFWGNSDIPAIREPARELNRALSQLSMILELSGNPIAVLENVEDAQDIAVQPGAVWEIPERARAYLLDLLQGGGVKLHTDYIDVLYRALHDLAEAPRTAFGDNRQALSGVALEMELHPLLQKIRRKRLIRSGVYRRRAEMILRLLERYTGQRYLPCYIKTVWGPVLPQDRSRLVQDEKTLVEAGIHSRQRAMADLGVEDGEGEFKRWLEEESKMKGGQ
ncbi:MAG: phage portal protein [Chloroflexi bacterium]|nr:phage portal protein [Chloroflexota bacterium]